MDSQALDALPDDVAALLRELLKRQRALLGPQLLGLYLRGSLALGDFDPHTSDVDALCVTEAQPSAAQEAALKALHLELAQWPTRYATELELAYLPRASAWRWQPGESFLTLSRGSGELEWKTHGENWVLERWSVLQTPHALHGPPPATFFEPVTAAQIRRAVLHRLHDWHAFALTPDDPGWGHRGHAAYATETVCRMLHALKTGRLGSKAQALAWAVPRLPDPWRGLVARSPAWKIDSGNDASTDAELNGQVQALIVWAVQQANTGFPGLRQD